MKWFGKINPNRHVDLDLVRKDNLESIKKVKISKKMQLQTIIEKMVLSTENTHICSKLIAWNHNCHMYIQVSYIQQASHKVQIAKVLMKFSICGHLC